MADKRSDVYWEDDRLIIRASSFGRCIGSLVRVGQGQTPLAPPDSMEQRWEEGTAMEGAIMEYAREVGWKPLDEFSYPEVEWGEDGQPELELQVGKVTIRCHPDGIGQAYKQYSTPADWNWKIKDRRVLEAKFLRPSMNHLTFPPYLWQMSIEMASSGLPGLWIIAEKTDDGEGGVKMGKMVVDPVDEPYFTLADIKRRALTIYKAVKTNGEVACDWRQFPCGFWQEEDALCHKSASDQIPMFPEDIREEAMRAVGDYARGKKLEKKSKDVIRDAADRVKKLVEGLDGSAYGGEGMVVRKKKRKVAKVKAEYEETDEDFWEVRES